MAPFFIVMTVINQGFMLGYKKSLIQCMFYDENGTCLNEDTED
jgi:hypothetical protein